jgi:hypothetical protein
MIYPTKKGEPEMHFKANRLRIACSVALFCGLLTLPANLQAQTASPSLVGQLSKELSISRPQARGGAGTLFALAKNRLNPDEFGKISSVVPGMGTLLKAAPVTPEHSEFASLESSLPGNMGRMAEVAEAFHKLGLSPEMAAKFVPVMTRFLESKGGRETASLLEKALK